MLSRSTARFVILGTLLVASPGCSKSEAHPAGGQTGATSPPGAAASDAKSEAQKTFMGRCVVCHGEKGMGDGPGSAALNPKPRNYTDAAWQASVTDDQIKNVIVNGGAAVGKSPLMPGSPDLMAKPEVVAELAKIVRSFKH
ncbi:MAG TPA: c-type cytochrome [Polyangiaceae bacterium]|jgi:mono/diheme cytochrome c family protein|nr:c-type cytochrome [Polyangiaceae bacterium]